MTRIIRVSGCHDCPYDSFVYDDWGDFDKSTCIKLERLDVTDYVDTKTLPDNCPLEEEERKNKYYTNGQPHFKH